MVWVKKVWRGSIHPCCHLVVLFQLPHTIDKFTHYYWQFITPKYPRRYPDYVCLPSHNWKKADNAGIPCETRRNPRWTEQVRMILFNQFIVGFFFQIFYSKHWGSDISVYIYIYIYLLIVAPRVWVRSHAGILYFKFVYIYILFIYCLPKNNLSFVIFFFFCI